MAAAATPDSMRIVLFCRARKASAPSRIAVAISCISGLPVSAARTCLARTQATPSDSTLMPRTIPNTASTPMTPPVPTSAWDCRGGRAMARPQGAVTASCGFPPVRPGGPVGPRKTGRGYVKSRRDATISGMADRPVGRVLLLRRDLDRGAVEGERVPGAPRHQEGQAAPAPPVLAARRRDAHRVRNAVVGARQQRLGLGR